VQLTASTDRFVKSATSDERWPENMFISGGNPHLGVFCDRHIKDVRRMN
jgi:hypothetical protein